MLYVVCERPDYSCPVEYINILRDMVARNLPADYEGQFVCFSMDPEGLDERVTYIHGHYDPSKFKDGRVLVLPMGAVIVGALDEIISHPIFDNHIPALWELSALFPGQIVNYQPDGDFPMGAKIVLFTKQKPHQCDGWVKDVWKIGGMSATEITFIGSNVSQEKLVEHIVSAQARNAAWIETIPAHPIPAVIVAGGPSLKRSIGTIKRMQRDGAHIFALNNAVSFLLEREIVPDFHVLLDAWEETIPYIRTDAPMRRYYASQCDPRVLDMAGEELILWNPHIIDLETAIPDLREPTVKGGSTVGTRVLWLTHTLGYRTLHLFGMDSSYENGEGHAYSQVDYKNTIQVKFGSKDYLSAAPLVGQVQEFKRILPALVDAGCVVTVHGDGLLPDVAAEMLRSAA